MQLDKQSKWQSQQIHKYWKNHSSHWKRHVWSNLKKGTNSNSANPSYRNVRNWGGQGRLTKRLNDKVSSIEDCHNIIKDQVHVSYVYQQDNYKSDHMEDINHSSPLWSCINCTYNNSSLFSKCQLCNTPNYSLQIHQQEKPNKDAHESTLTLADYIPSPQLGYEVENDDLMQIAIQLSYQQNNTIKTKVKSKRSMIQKYKYKNIKRSSFASYWNELQNDKKMRKILLFRKYNKKYLREGSILSDIQIKNNMDMIFKMYPQSLSWKQSAEYMRMKSMIPSVTEIRDQFSTSFIHAKFWINCIISPYLLYQFFHYGCHENINPNHIKIVYTDAKLKYYNIDQNATILPGIPGQELLFYGVIRKYYPDLVRIPHELIRLMSIFLTNNPKEAWRFNIRNGPTKQINCYSNFTEIDDGYKVKEGQIYVCLMKSKKKIIKAKDDDDFTAKVIRNTNILPIYSINWNEWLGEKTWRVKRWGGYWSHFDCYGPSTYWTTKDQNIMEFKVTFN